MEVYQLLFNGMKMTIREYLKIDFLILEAQLFFNICVELKDYLKTQYQDYFRLMKFDSEMEDAMIDGQFIQLILNDILSTGEYSITGVATYIHMPEEVIYDLFMGRNTNPFLALSRKIIELHRTVRPQLYQEIIQKILKESESE